jgi:hypothetical protein
MFGMVNGAVGGGTLGYSIESTNTQPYHNHSINILLGLNAGDAVNAAWGDGAAGTVQLSQSLNTALTLQWISPAGTRTF